MKSRLLGLCAALLLAQPATAEIVHDGEYLYLRAQFGEKWDAEDREVDDKLAQIRQQNGGKRPNILYVLIDDVSFGQMGNRTMNYVTGYDTPNINEFATQGMQLMRMYTEPSCTPTRAAFLTGRHPVRSDRHPVLPHMTACTKPKPRRLHLTAGNVARLRLLLRPSRAVPAPMCRPARSPRMAASPSSARRSR